MKTIKLSEEYNKIYTKGEIKKEDKYSIAIIGSRNPSEYGIKVANYFSSYLAKKGITIISGLAYGIDTISHWAALKAKGRTIGVMGSGIDIIYPKENTLLYKEVEKNGAIISQFELGEKPYGKNFLIRNRLISYLSKAVLVVEGKKRSGTLSTASYAASIGREVFAVPGRIDSLLSQAPLYLLNEGARLAIDPNEIYEYIVAGF